MFSLGPVLIKCVLFTSVSLGEKVVIAFPQRPVSERQCYKSGRKMSLSRSSPQEAEASSTSWKQDADGRVPSMILA